MLIVDLAAWSLCEILRLAPHVALQLVQKAPDLLRLVPFTSSTLSARKARRWYTTSDLSRSAMKLPASS